jgi:putative ABC transport system permease protein
MLKNYLKVAFRKLLKNKSNTLINIIGLAAGVCAVMLICVYISFEISFDTFHKDADRIYRVSVASAGKQKQTSESPVFLEPLAPAMKNEIPEVEKYCRVTVEKIGLVSSNNQHMQIKSVRFADSLFFDFFSYGLKNGNPGQVLNRPFTAVITEETSARLFGDKNPVGQMIKFNDVQYEITGLAKNPQKNSHLGFDLLLSFNSLYQLPNIFLGWDGGQQYISYVKLNDSNQAEVVNRKLISLMWNNLNKRIQSFGFKFTAGLQPIKDIHLQYDDETHARLTNIYIFLAVAILILLIACINYINLTIASSLKRNKEVGVRKVFGASKISLIRQFMSESILIVIFSYIVSLIGLYLIFPYYKQFVGDYYDVDIPINLYSVLMFSIAVVLICIAASFYPSFYLSRMTPINAINQKGKQRYSRINVRNSLILIQFIISTAMISATLIINSQLDYVKNRNIGYQKENVLILQLNNAESRENYKTLKNEMIKLSGVKNVAVSSEIPVGGLESNGYIVEGDEKPTMINIVDTDKDFLDIYKIKIVSGRNFYAESEFDKGSYLVNEEFVKKFGLKDPIGKTVNRRTPHKIIGVVANFNFASAYENIGPLLISSFPEDNTFNFLSVRINPTNTGDIIESIKNIYAKICPESPLEYSFLDESLAKLYEDETNFKTLFICFSMLAILISVIGLLGLTTISLAHKKKEIGIRKVLGASVPGIIKLAYKEYFVILIVAFAIASVISKYFTDLWLSSFVYKIVPSFWLFFLAGFISIIVPFITVLIFSLKTATANPVESLRYE